MWSFTLRLTLFVLLGLSLVAPASAASSQAPFTGNPEQIQLTVTRPITRAAGGDYLLPETRTNRPFTHLMIRRESSESAGTLITLALRVSTDGVNWTDWQQLTDSDEPNRSTDSLDTHWSELATVGAVAQFWQVRASFTSAPNGSQATLRQVQVDTVDTRLSPAQARAESEALANARTARANGVSKPSVVSRTAWGSPDGQGSRVAPAYYSVNHMIVHHTADANTLVGSEQSWADRVRAEWAFHTNSRGWGDVGYNFLIDPNGVIYEGRAGGDDAVGFHDTANYGSMGVVLLGTFSSATPTDASQQSLTRLLAWKAGQKKIDPLASSYYYGCSTSQYCAPVVGSAIIPNIAGHRQVTPGHTTCPGDAMMAILPRIRHDVATLLAGDASLPPDNGDLQIDEFESGFSKSTANWYSAACGAGGNTFYTYATDSLGQSANTATWKPRVAKTGSYRVYASVPQNCGLGSPPYASAKAKYTITYADGSSQRTIDQNTASAWVDLGVYRFNAGDSGSVTLGDMTGEPYAQRKVLFYDAIKWVPEDAAATNAQLTAVRFTGPSAADPFKVPSGGLLKVTFTIKNAGSTTLYTQQPQASLSADGTTYNDASSSKTDDAYVYDEGECFIGNAAGTYGAFPKESNRFRLTLGTANASDLNLDCAGAVGSSDVGFFPWRWGLNGPLAPGETRDIVGYVRFRNTTVVDRQVTLKPGLIQEYVGYSPVNLPDTTLTITPERGKPSLTALGNGMLPQAQVYQLGTIPINFLARTSNASSIPVGDYLGSFTWNGGFSDWHSGGPLGATGPTDSFVIQQTRAFAVPTSGSYSFRTISDDGSWLWIDGKQLIGNYGLHGVDVPMTATLQLDPGVHIVSFEYFDRNGYAAAGYEMQAPGGSFGPLPDASAGGALALGNTFVQTPKLTLAADDLGGVGVAKFRYTLDGSTWLESPGPLLQLGNLQNGSYAIRYQAYDMLGNWSEASTTFTVDTNKPFYQVRLPMAKQP